MYGLTVQLSPEARRELATLQRQMPQIYRRAFGFAASVGVKKLRKVIRQGGGSEGVPTFPAKADVTRKLHGKGNWYGKLGKGKVISRWRDGGAQKIGWVHEAASWVENLQEAESSTFSPAARHWLHKQLGETIPSFYSRPMRRVIDPFAETLNRGEFARWVAGAAENISNGKVKTPERRAVAETKGAK